MIAERVLKRRHAAVTVDQRAEVDNPKLDLQIGQVREIGVQRGELGGELLRGEAPVEVRVRRLHAFDEITQVFADTLADLARKDERIVAITAAMPDGTGLDRFAKEFPSRTFDVGICEQHAVLFAAGMATQGLKPVCAIYSTFLQRAYDQVFHDVSLMDLPVVFALDRGGVVGADGPTHHGAYDLSYLRVFPNMHVAAPKDENELRGLLATALALGRPVAIRYPRGAGHGVALDPEPKPLPVGKGEVLRIGKDGVVFAIGDPVLPALRAAERLAAEGGASLGVVNARWVKPIDTELVSQLVKPGTTVLTVEENAVAGGFGSAVSESLDVRGIAAPVHRLGIPDRFVPHATQAEQRAELGIDEDGLLAAFRARTAGAGVVPIRARVAS